MSQAGNIESTWPSVFWERVYMHCIGQGMAPDAAFLRANIAESDRLRAGRKCVECLHILAVHNDHEGHCAEPRCECKSWTRG